jgi:hypothetical protein
MTRVRPPARLSAISAVLGAVAVFIVSACDGPDEGAATSACGSKELFGKTLKIRVVGDRIPCSQVREIIRGPCRDGRTWSCFSFHPPSPVLVWFRERERFKRDWSTAIEARRYPCREATVTRETWAEAGREYSGFPNQRQVLADDLIRCGLLKGMTYKAALRLLGPGGEPSFEKGKRYLRYLLGDERDSFFQVDDEFLSIRFGHDGTFESARIVQG